MICSFMWSCCFACEIGWLYSCVVIVMGHVLCCTVKPLQCEPNEFQCTSGKCVLTIWQCDADNDCGDLSDELDCRMYIHLQHSGYLTTVLCVPRLPPTNPHVTFLDSHKCNKRQGATFPHSLLHNYNIASIHHKCGGRHMTYIVSELVKAYAVFRNESAVFTCVYFR